MKMTPDLPNMPDEIPGLREAREREQLIRDVSCSDALVSVHGVWVKQFTLKHWLDLTLYGSPFLGGSRFAMSQRARVLDFLWIVSPDYRAGATFRQLWFWLRNWRSINGSAAPAIVSYLNSAFQDAPGVSHAGSDRRLYYSGIASLCHLFAREFGWRTADTMNEPVARLFQYYNQIRQQNDPQAIMFNPSDRVLGEWLHARASNSQPNGGTNNG